MSSAELNVLVNQFVAAVVSDEDSTVSAQKIASIIEADDASLLQLIQTLGPKLTSDDSSTRTQAVHCLATTLAQKALSAKLSKQDVGVLLQFLVTKLEDEKLSIYVLQALGLLVQYKNFLPAVNNNLENLLSAVSTKYEPRKHLAKVRYEASVLLESLFSSHSAVIATNPKYAEDFVSAFIHIAGGEKDPRNLLISFKLNTSINQTVQFEDRTTNSTHDRLLSELFDVSFCYFPISFTPPPNDPYKITAPQLKTELRDTIASQSQYAQDTFPSLFEKLTSTNPAVRNDVLLTIYQCVLQYSQSTVEQYWVSIWDALKFEILHNDVLIFKPEAEYIIPPAAETLEDTDDNKTLIYTLKTICAIAEKLADSDTQDSFMETVTSNLEKNFKSLNEKTLKQSVLILSAIGSTSAKLYNAVVEFVFSFEIWGKYIRSDYQEPHDEEEVDVALTIARQRELIDNLGFIFTAARILNQATNLENYKDHLLIFMGQLLQTSSKLEKTLKCKIIQQLVKLIGLHEFLSREEVKLILGWLNDTLVGIVESETTNWESDILLLEIINGFVRVMSEGPDDAVYLNVSSIIEIVLPELLNHISDPGVLKLVNKLCVNYQFLEVLSIRLLNKLAYDDYDAHSYAAMVQCLIDSFTQTQSVKPFLTNSWYKKFIPRFLSVTITKCNDDLMVYDLSGQLFGLVVRYMEKAKHQEILDEMIPVFIESKKYEGIVLEDVLSKPSPKVTLLKYFLAKIDKNTQLPGDSDYYIQKTIGVFREMHDQFLSLEYLQVLSLLVNKFTPQNGELIDKLLEKTYETIEQNFEDLEVFVWIVKALIVRIDSVGSKYLDLIVKDLTQSSNISFSMTLSQSFNVLMADLDIYVNKENSKPKIISGVMNTNVRLLYKQQIFEKVLKSLIESFKKVKDNTKRGVLLSTLAIIINNVSTKILRSHLEAVFPLVLNGLTFEDSAILEASLQTFKVIIFESPQLILENLGSLIEKLTELSISKIVVNKHLVNNEQIRLLSLECLMGLFQKLELAEVLKYQIPIRNRLTVGLDDKKRSVRKKTSDVRQMLYELDR